ncbi:hypothetical protein [Streptomyces soliscabiei]|uniref:hypothetical protein n=1 Tax=Streptomyces soliscabiei TaxID=588897 RepID=UPI0029BA9ADE|nr:hypothetical protein [Streptomyces sp. NY05-11A]MDX2681685.1 hypothetical protein [Streptomyces sp. NY05-11A]
MFTWLWCIGLSALALPCAVLMLKGWAPRRYRRRTVPWAIQVRGVAMLVLWAGGMLTPLIRHSELEPEDASFLSSVVPSGFTLFALGILCGSHLAEGFYRRSLRTRSLHRTPDGDTAL